MNVNTAKMLAKAKPNIASLMRTRPYYTVPNMILQYKTHVLGLLELNIGVFYHACDTILETIANIQNSFVKKLDLFVEQAFLDHNLAPLCTRRDIAMLGLLYKCAHGQAHPELCELFRRQEPMHCWQTRLQSNRHNIQLVEDEDGTRHEFLRRSIFGLVRIWNRLDQTLVEAPSCSKFQGALTELVRNRCRANSENWEKFFSPRTVLTSAHERYYCQ